MSLPVHQKYLLSIKEASEYFSIGVKKLRVFAGSHPDLVIFHGNKYLILREKMEEYLASFPQGKNGSAQL